MYQFFLTLAALFLFMASQKRVFASLYILTKYSGSSMKWVSHIVETPTQRAATVNEMDYTQVFGNINFMRRPCSGGQLSLQIYAWTFLPRKHTLNLHMSCWVVILSQHFCVWEQTGANTMTVPWLKCQRRFSEGEMAWMQREALQSNAADSC